jgi:hypothetical protein
MKANNGVEVRGFESVEEAEIHCEQAGGAGLYFVAFSIRGVSNGPEFAFTLPVVPGLTGNLKDVRAVSLQIVDNGKAQAAPGMVVLEKNQAFAQVYRDAAMTPFSAKGVKEANGFAIYKR